MTKSSQLPFNLHAVNILCKPLTILPKNPSNNHSTLDNSIQSVFFKVHLKTQKHLPRSSATGS